MNNNKQILDVELKIIFTTTAIKFITTNILTKIATDEFGIDSEQSCYADKEENSYLFLEKLLPLTNSYQCYLRNAGTGSEGDQLIDLVIATDSDNQANQELLAHFSSETIALKGVQQNNGQDGNHFLVTSVSLLPTNIGENSAYSIPAKITFYRPKKATYYGLGISEEIIKKLESLPSSQKYYRITNQRLDDWRHYLDIKREMAEEKYFSVRYEGYKDNLGDKRLEFYLQRDSLTSQLVKKINRALGSPLILKGLAKENSNNMYDRGLIIGELVKFNQNSMRLTVKLTTATKEKINQVKTRPPQKGCLDYKPIGDLTEINRRKRGLDRFRKGQIANLNLPQFMFNPQKSRLPEDKFKLKREQLFIESLNQRQFEAVENAINTKDLYLVKGPPGTGKTTVITEMCYQIVGQGKKVLLASQSNLAVDNVMARLLEVPKVRALRLGSSPEEEGMPFTEDQIVKSWLGNAATKAGQKLEACQNQIDFAKQFKEIKTRLTNYRELREKEESQSDKLKKVEEKKVNLEEKLQQVNDTLTNYQAASKLLQKIKSDSLTGKAKENILIKELLLANDNYFNVINKLSDISQKLGLFFGDEFESLTLNYQPQELKEFTITELNVYVKNIKELIEDVLEFYNQDLEVSQHFKAKINQFRKIQQQLDTTELNQLLDKRDTLKAEITDLKERLREEEAKVKSYQEYYQQLKSKGLKVDELVNNLSKISLNDLINQLTTTVPQELKQDILPAELFTKLWNKSCKRLKEKLNAWQADLKEVDDLNLAARELEAIKDLNQAFISELKEKLTRIQGYTNQDFKLILEPQAFAQPIQNELFNYIERFSNQYWKASSGAYVELSSIGQEYLASDKIKNLEIAFKNFSEFNFKVKKEYHKLKNSLTKQKKLKDNLKAELTTLIYQILTEESNKLIKNSNKQVKELKEQLATLIEQEEKIEQKITVNKEKVAQLKNKLATIFEQLKVELDGANQDNPIFKSLFKKANQLISKDLIDQSEQLHKLITNWNYEYQELKEIIITLKDNSFATEFIKLVKTIKSDFDYQIKELINKVDKLTTRLEGVIDRISYLKDNLNQLNEKIKTDYNWWKKVVGEFAYFQQSEIQAKLKVTNFDSLEFINYIINQAQVATADYQDNLKYLHRFSDIVESWQQKVNELNDGQELELKRLYIQQANVIGTTCSNAGAKTFIQDYDDFDYVIIDEVSKATPPELLLPLLKGKKIILIGDDKQLPPMVGHDTIEELAQKLGKTKEELEHIKSSLFAELWNSASAEIKTMLDIQYRMHPDIMGVINQFYGGKLKSGLKNPNQTRDHGLELPYISNSNHSLWVDAPLNRNCQERKVGTSYQNKFEVQVIQEIVADLNQFWAKKDSTKPKKVGLITFYAPQARLLTTKIANSDKYSSLDLRVGTVDRFQGMEREIIIVSMVRNNSNQNIGFARSPKRINVALSRAKELLILVGSSQLFCHESYASNATQIYSNVAQIINSKGGIIHASKILNNNF